MYFGRINKDKTIENSRRVLEKYEYMHNIELRELVSLQSPIMSDEPKAQNVNNSSEDKAIRFVQAKSYCSTVRNAIEVIENEVYRIILQDTYLVSNFQGNRSVMDHIASSGNRIEEAQFYRIKNEALICFAEVCPPVYIDNDMQKTFELLAFR
ncbi:ArpU family phage packaging/lysis transcriptional regulator [Lentilactobacillus kribbianus]|uniref:ArpU family phage packaging/lysis transcriptional regulator n=1 Tax=Lentilactobacillus kribbianus TaxID=2729622 RepID=UPI0015517EF3